MWPTALDARFLKRQQRTLGGIYQSVLRAELTHRYGVAFEPIVNRQAEISASSGCSSVAAPRVRWGVWPHRCRSSERNRYSGLAAADDVDVLDVNEYRSSVTVAFKTTHDRGQVILGPDELAKDADVTRSRWTFDADTTRCVVRENASNLDPKAAERE
jgi:hypothetical protein